MDNLCEQCGLYQYSDNPKIKGKGSDKPKLVLIGEAPGPEEAKEGKIFIGKAGKKLHSMLIPYYDLGIYITNAVKCFPPMSTLNPDKGFRVPKLVEIEYCTPILYKELAKFDPTPILMPLGNTALYATTNRIGGISKCIGYKFFPKLNLKEYTVIPNYHPSYIVRNPKMELEFIRVMEIVKEYINANTGTTGSS